MQVEYESLLICSHCGHAEREQMPDNYCQFYYDCRGCGALLRANPGDCCVYCSFGSVPCPPVQLARAGQGGGCCE